MPVRRLTLPEALALGHDAWDSLAGPGRDSPFRGWTFHQAWADSASPSELDDAFVLVVDTPSGIDAILPLRHIRRDFHRVPVTVLTWAVADDGCPDHLDILARNDAAVDVLADAAWAEPWNLLDLTAVAGDAVRMPAFEERMREKGCRVVRQETHRCPWLVLPKSWEEYLAGVSSHRRHGLRRLERVLQKNHAIEVTYHDAANVDEGWRRLMTLHEKRWGGRSEFADARQIALHQRFAAGCAANGTLWLATMTVDGEPGAAWYMFRHGSTLYSYQSGFDPKWRKERVGQVLLGMIMQRAMEQGLTEFDFLRGLEAYKADWTSTDRACYQVASFRPGLKGSVLQALEWAAEHRPQAAPAPAAEDQ